MHNSGKITVAYDVADWEDGGDYQLEFCLLYTTEAADEL